MHHSVVPSDGPSTNNLYKEKDAMRHLILLIALLALTGCTDVEAIDKPPAHQGMITVELCATAPKGMRFGPLPGLSMSIELPTMERHTNCYINTRTPTCIHKATGPIKTGDAITVTIEHVYGLDILEEEITFDGTPLNSKSSSEGMTYTITSTFKPNP
jgi:hypothetical protein